MKKVIASLVAVAGLSVAAQGQGIIKFQVSPAGAENWTSSLDAAPGSMFDVRATVSYTGGAMPLGMASLFFQPTVSNWGAGDVLGAFANGGAGGNESTPAGVVDDAAGLYGRVRPWGANGLSTTSFLRGHIHTNPAPGFTGTFLRISQNQNTAWLGATGNTTGGSGVPIRQFNNIGRTAATPPFMTNLGNQGVPIVIFKYKVTLGADDAARTLSVDAPAAGIGNRSTTTLNGQIYWYATDSETTGSIRGDASVMTASVNVVPTPASLALLGLGGLAIGRRRR